MGMFGHYNLKAPHHQWLRFNHKDFILRQEGQFITFFLLVSFVSHCHNLIFKDIFLSLTEKQIQVPYSKQCLISLHTVSQLVFAKLQHLH